MYSDFAVVNIGTNKQICNSPRTCYRHFYFSEYPSPRRTMVPTKLWLIIAKVSCAVDFIPVMRIAVHLNRRTRHVVFHNDKQYVLALVNVVGDIDGKRREKAFVAACHSAVDIHFCDIIYRLKIKNIIFYLVLR